MNTSFGSMSQFMGDIHDLKHSRDSNSTRNPALGPWSEIDWDSWVPISTRDPALGLWLDIDRDSSFA